MRPATLHWEGNAASGFVHLLDQTLLPGEVRVLAIRDPAGMVAAILRLAVRGAPALGVAGAYGLVLGLQPAASARSSAEFLERARAVAVSLAAARPTAVNLPGALRRAVAELERRAEAGSSPGELLEGSLQFAHALHAAEVAACEAMGTFGADLLADGAGVLTHCNAGALCTVGIGTALAPIYVAARQGKRLRVFADETRPLWQGARLTAFELAQAGLDVTVITDGMAGTVLARGMVSAVIVGADRIARNGDVANKVGTYPLAVLARRHGVPFHVVAPLTTLDPECARGAEIPIEERAAAEVAAPFGRTLVPPGVRVFNPAFDVTPAELVTSLVSERGVVEAPDEGRLTDWMRRARTGV